MPRAVINVCVCVLCERPHDHNKARGARHIGLDQGPRLDGGQNVRANCGSDCDWVSECANQRGFAHLSPGKQKHSDRPDRIAHNSAGHSHSRTGPDRWTCTSTLQRHNDNDNCGARNHEHAPACRRLLTPCLCECVCAVITEKTSVSTVLTVHTTRHD